MDKLVLLTVAVLCMGWSPTRAQVDGDNYRLPNNSYPLRYDLELTTYVHEDGSARQFRFDGRVKIELVVRDEGNSSITVHYRKTTITHVKLWALYDNGTEHVLLDDSSSFTLDPQREFVTVTPPGGILNGTYFLEFIYHGELREDNAGFYRSSYVDDEGRTRWLATTQFSSTDARHAFPCYDEPGIRAPIGLTVIHGENYSVLSNNLVRETGRGPIEGYARTVFLDTPRMQPYLLGIIVSDFVSVSSELYPRQRVFARYNAIRNGEGDFILEAGHKILNVLEKYLETVYVLPKIYQVAIPDFAAGAMENYGLVTYKEEKFFYDARSSPMKQKNAIATVVGHEFGHQYFGNLVSPAWWSYLWMKEGFARYFEYLASDLAFPQLRIRETYTVDKMQNAFELDSLGSSRPMTYYVNTQAEIANVFDNIAYDKGGSIMRMFQHAFGAETFRLALINYLKANAFQAAHPEDFAAAIQRAIDSFADAILPPSITALDVLKSWTEKSGYPVIHVSRGLDLRITLTQERYLLKLIDTSETKWILPYNFATAKDPNFESTTNMGWLVTNSMTLGGGGNLTLSDWVIFNKQQTGYYRVNYDERLWNLIIAQLYRDPFVIHNMNRAQLIDDSMNLARSGRLGYDTALRLVAYLATERDYVPWAAASRNLGLLTQLFAGSPQMHLLKRYLLSAVSPAFAQLGLITNPSDSLFTRQTRELVARWACAMGSEECLKKSAELVLQTVNPPFMIIDPDLRNVIYCYGLRHANKEVFLAIWNRMQASKDQLFRTDLIYALGCTESDELKQLFLNTSIAEGAGSNYFNQERERVFAAVYMGGENAVEIALKFFAENMMKIDELYNKGNFGGRAIGSAVTGLAKYIVNHQLNNQFSELIEKLSQAGILRDTDILRALEQSSDNLQWVETKGRYIEDWLNMHYPPPTTTEVPTTTTTTTRTRTTMRRTTTTTEMTPPGTPATTERTTRVPTTATTEGGGSDSEEFTTAAPLVETTTEPTDGTSLSLVSASLLVFSVVISIRHIQSIEFF